MAEDPDKRTSRTPSGPRRTTRSRLESDSDQAALLVVLVGSDPGRRISIGEGLIIGRDVDGRGLVMDEGVSRRHLRMSRQADGSHLVEDLGSRNGTYVNGQRIEAAPVRSGDKIAVGSGTILLFTHNDRYEEQVLRAQKWQALGELAGGAAEDFDNLLVALVGNIDYLRTNPRAAQTEECLAEMETAARRAAQLTRQLLSFARKPATTIEPVDVPALIAEAIAALQRTIPRTVAIDAKVTDHLVTMGDAAQLMQVLLNIGLNAGQAMPDGGRLSIRARRCTESDRLPEGIVASRTLRIDMEDNGAGMNEAALARVFQPFFSTKPEGEGTGLGLSIAQSVVCDHGGEIEIRSRAGDGTRVSVFLPAAEPTHSHEAADADGLTPLRGSVLVIDAESLVRNAARRLLQSFGLTAWAARDVADARRHLEEHGATLDVVILTEEPRGPRLATTVAAIRTHAPRAELVLATNSSGPKELQRLDRLGIRITLPKPWGARRLWGRVWVALERRGP